ncbi:hypothetical protein [Kribbella sp. DT2]|uniref:ATP-dependent DNA ligase n=1 Tax=Kribbella sp. DT2 TaxID=3393427 RepID=UPI003CEFE983
MSTTLTTSKTAGPSDRLKINGELVAYVDGRLSFDALQRRMATSSGRGPATSYVAFDLLAIGGVDLRRLRWTVRRTRLEGLAEGWASTSLLQLCPATDDIDEAREWFDVLPDAMGIEGLVCKGASSRYVGGRRTDWLKVNSIGVGVSDRFASGTRCPGQVAAWHPAVVRDRCRGRVVAG